jgi:type IV pilus assembly protein PilC
MTNSHEPRRDDQAATLAVTESLSVAGAVSTVIDQRRSLATGLAALSEDAPSSAVRRELRTMSERVSQGASLQEALKDCRGVPNSFRLAAEAGAAANRLVPALYEYQLAREQTRQHRATLWAALSYPLFVALFGLGLLFVIYQWLVPQFREIFESFGVELPWLTLMVVTLSDLLRNGLILWAGLAVIGVVVGILALRAFLCDVARVFHFVPLVGSTFYWSGVSEFCRWMALFVRAQAPIGPALRATADVVGDPWISYCARQMAAETETGASLETAAGMFAGVPDPIVSVCRWANQGETFADLLRSSSEIFASQAQMRARLLRMLLAPLLLIGISGFMVLTIFAMLIPLIRLLGQLT